MGQLRIYISDVAFTITCPFPQVITTLGKSLAPCQSPLLPTLRHCRITVDDRGTINCDGVVVTPCLAPCDLAAKIESIIYDALDDFHAEWISVHAALAVRDRQALLLVGTSGTGKSSLVREAVLRGFLYFTDDITVFDGEKLWGVPRAIQFKPLSAGDTPPPWLADCDVSTYQLTQRNGQTAVLPLFPLRAEQVASAPVAADNVIIVHLRRAEGITELTPCSPHHSLIALNQAIVGHLRPSSPDVGQLIQQGKSFCLCWTEPQAALDLIETSLLFIKAHRVGDIG